MRPKENRNEMRKNRQERDHKGREDRKLKKRGQDKQRGEKTSVKKRMED